MSKQDKKMTFTGPTAFSNIEKFQIKLLTKFVLLYIVLLYTYSALPSKKIDFLAFSFTKWCMIKNNPKV